MIAFGAFAGLAGVSNDFIKFIGNANLALFVGLLWAYLLARRLIGVERTNTALSEGFRTSGEILLITGVGGSLGEVITAAGMGDALGQLFSADAGGPVLLSILLAWFIAAVLHLAIGSVSVAALTASEHHRAAPAAALGLAGGDRARDRLRRAVRGAGQQQLLLDVQGAARPLHDRRAQDADRGHLDRVGGVAAAGDPRQRVPVGSPGSG